MVRSLAIGLAITWVAAAPALAREGRRIDPGSATGRVLDRSLGTNTFGPDPRDSREDRRRRLERGGATPGTTDGTTSGTTPGTTSGTTPGTLSGTIDGFR